MLISEEDTQPSIMDVFCRRPIVAIVLIFGISAGWVFVHQSIYPFYNFLKSPALHYKLPRLTSVHPLMWCKVFITEPIERAAASDPGVDYIDSNTTLGLSTVNVWLKLNEDSTDALAELSARLDQIRFELPEGAEDPSVQVVRADRPFAVFYLNVQIR